MVDTQSQIVFLLGAPRSGTSWLQRLLGAHPGVASPQETHVGTYLKDLLQPFDRSFADIRTALEAISRSQAPPNRLIGLPMILSAEDMLDVCRLLVDLVVAAALALKPSAMVVIEKGTNVNSFEYVERVVPEARYILLGRHPFEVVSSLVRAGRGWGADWAPTSAEDAAAWWVWFSEEGEQISWAASERCIRLRYEDLVEAPLNVLPRVFTWLGVDGAESACRSVLERVPVGGEGEWTFVMGGEAMRVANEFGLRDGWREPDGFGTGTPPRWQEVLTAEEAARARTIVAERAAALGYDVAP